MRIVSKGELASFFDPVPCSVNLKINHQELSMIGWSFRQARRSVQPSRVVGKIMMTTAPLGALNEPQMDAHSHTAALSSDISHLF